MTAFVTDITHLDGRVIVDLIGELDLTTEAELRDALSPLVYRYDADQIIVDCEALQFVDVRGLNELIRFSRASKSGQVRLRNIPPPLALVLDVTGANQVFDIEASVASDR